MGERVGKNNLHTGRREGKESDGRESGSKSLTWARELVKITYMGERVGQNNLHGRESGGRRLQSDVQPS